MKQLIISTTVFLFSIVLYSQEEERMSVFEADSTWQQEIIKFPLGFAQEIAYEGFEDIRFAQGWAKKDSSEFWTYTFAWHVKGIKQQTVDLLETHLALYFNGLTLPHDNEVQKKPKATVLIIKNETLNQESEYMGKIRMYDKFHTKKPITLYCRVKTRFCEMKQTSTIVFRFSSQRFDHTVWRKFEEVSLRNDLCEY